MEMSKRKRITQKAAARELLLFVPKSISLRHQPNGLKKPSCSAGAADGISAGAAEGTAQEIGHGAGRLIRLKPVADAAQLLDGLLATLDGGRGGGKRYRGSGLSRHRCGRGSGAGLFDGGCDRLRRRSGGSNGGGGHPSSAGKDAPKRKKNVHSAQNKQIRTVCTPM